MDFLIVANLINRIRKSILWQGITVTFVLFFSGCFLDSEMQPFYGVAKTTKSQEFRWSDGGLPKVFDPALATAPPDTDAVRALYEGLTEFDSSALSAVPALATSWSSSTDGRTWTFYLRHDARWSNGDSVTAHDFVRSWKRVLNMGQKSPNARLLSNIEGAVPVPLPTASPKPTPVVPEIKPQAEVAETPLTPTNPKPEPTPTPKPLGVEAIGDYALQVRLDQPDKDFPNLVAHPGFRPVHIETGSEISNSTSISNGAFELAQTGTDSVILKRSDNYWNAGATQLERVRFVAFSNSEGALAAYKAGEVDAVSNAALEPLAIKLLSPYSDFKRSTYAALTLYNFNQTKPPFNDIKVREALCISIDRDRISQDVMGGSTVPADKYLPDNQQPKNTPKTEKTSTWATNIARARALLFQAGFPDGKGFPKISLLINRNEQQRVVAQTIASMWKTALNIDTEVVARNWDEYETALNTGQYDIARRSVVMPAPDERIIISMLFEVGLPPVSDPVGTPVKVPDNSASIGPPAYRNEPPANDGVSQAETSPIQTEAAALKQFAAIPLFFASSYALVKPYVSGFETNLQDAPSLKSVKIDPDWEPPAKPKTVWWK